MMFDTFDRTGEAEFAFPRAVVFRALCQSIEQIKGMTIEGRDDNSGRLDVKTGVSAFSWGERISISVRSSGTEASLISVQSGAKTIFGSATVHGKNRQNVREILSATSTMLERFGQKWREELPPAPSASIVGQTAAKSSLADELSKLAELRDRGILSAEEFQEQKQRLLR